MNIPIRWTLSAIICNYIATQACLYWAFVIKDYLYIKVICHLMKLFERESFPPTSIHPVYSFAPTLLPGKIIRLPFLINFGEGSAFRTPLKRGITAKNTAISPNFLVWKFCGKKQFPHSFGQIARNYVETVSFHKISTPGN